jgi:hypothetical protein
VSGVELLPELARSFVITDDETKTAQTHPHGDVLGILFDQDLEHLQRETRLPGQHRDLSQPKAGLAMRRIGVPGALVVGKSSRRVPRLEQRAADHDRGGHAGLRQGFVQALGRLFLGRVGERKSGDPDEDHEETRNDETSRHGQSAPAGGSFQTLTRPEGFPRPRVP